MPYQSSSEDEDYLSSGDDQLSDEEEMAAVLATQKENGDEEAAIYNADIIHEKLEDIGWPEEQPWVECQAVTSAAPLQISNVDDDLERELAFYNQALDAAKAAIQRFEEASVPWQRPPDYYAEMVKGDDHMKKVKEQLVYEQKVIEEAEQRRKEREAKRYSKQVAAERKKEKAQEKKRAIETVSEIRKKRAKEGFAGDLDVDVALEEIDAKKPKGRLGERFQAKNTPSMKRAKKDAKFGFGGRKKLKKQNDAYSTAGGEYRRSSFDDGVRRKVAAKTATARANKRPGKTRRMQMRQKKH